MEYKVFGNTVVARIDRGEEILDKLRELAEKEQIACLFVTETVFAYACVYDIFYAYASVEQLAGSRYLVPLFIGLITVYIRYSCQSDAYACAVFISEADLYVVFIVKRRVDIIVFSEQRRTAVDEVVFLRFQETRLLRSYIAESALCIYGAEHNKRSFHQK